MPGIAEMNDEITAKLVNGWSLKTLMEPDPAISSNGKAHLESLDLRYVEVKNNLFWGYTLHQHLSISSEDYSLLLGAPLQITFLYSNLCGKRFFFLIKSRIDENRYYPVVLPLSRYRSHRWVLIDDYEEIFDSNTADLNAVATAIRQNQDLKCAFMDGQGTWRIGHVHIPYLIHDENRIYFQTEPCKTMPGLLAENWTGMDDDTADELLGRLYRTDILGGGADMTMPVVHTQFVIDLKGCMCSELQRSWFQAENLKVFKRKRSLECNSVQF
ncbi:MAG: hypothetical protein ACE14T_00045 [Syntrophales bacterium]